jgi:ribonuclease P protein component
MNRRYRLSSSADFKRVRRSGKSHAHPFAVLVSCPNDLPVPRFGFTAGRSIGSAVKRNRAKRLLREAIRIHLPVIKPGFDIVLIARPPLLDADWAELTRAVSRLLEKADLVDSVQVQ